MAVVTKSTGQLMDWTLLDDTGGTPFTETNELDSGEGLDTSIEAILYVDMCHRDTNAAGDEAYCAVLVKHGTTDEDWSVLQVFQATAGTANQGDCDAVSAASQPNVYLTSTTNFETPGDVYFLCDETTLADSCLVLNKDYVNDDYVISMDDLANAYDADDNLYDIVDQWQISLPDSVAAAKVIFYNTDADATYACRVRYTLITAIS